MMLNESLLNDAMYFLFLQRMTLLANFVGLQREKIGKFLLGISFW